MIHCVYVCALVRAYICYTFNGVFFPTQSIDIRTLYPNLAEMERDLPAFVSQRIRQLKATGKLIQEVDSIPNPPPRLPSGQLKNFKAPLPAVIEVSSWQYHLIIRLRHLSSLHNISSLHNMPSLCYWLLSVYAF